MTATCLRLYKFPWKNALELNYKQREEKLNLLKRPEQHKYNIILFKRKNLIKHLIPCKGVFKIPKAETQSCVRKVSYPKL